MRVTPADGTIFETLGFPDAGELKAKAELVIQIIEERGPKQVEAAEIVGVDQPKVSQLMHGKLDGFSMERLHRFLNALGMDVEIVVKPTRRAGRNPQFSVTRTAARPRYDDLRRSENTRPGISAENGPEIANTERLRVKAAST